MSSSSFSRRRVCDEERVRPSIRWVHHQWKPSRRLAIIAAGAFGLWILIYGASVLFTLPDVDEVGALFAAESTVITDRSGIELYRIHGGEDRTLVPLGRIADRVEQATIAIEDRRFYERGCFDPRAFLRAALRNITGGFGSQGGSTITQQFSRNALIGSRRKRITRKLKEYILSCKLERRYSKDEILELYLNRIPYGNNAYGVEQAARTYFAKSASGLSLAEAVVLASLPQLPSYLSPYGRHARTTLSEKGKERLRLGKIRSADDVRDDDFWIGIVGETFGMTPGIYIGGRTDQVLRNMEDQGFITEEERLQALAELQTIAFRRARENIRAPHFVFFIREFVEEKFRDRFDPGFLENGGLTITTTLDWDLQQIGERVVSEVGKVNRELYDTHNASLLAADPENGHILAYVGNRDYWDEETDGNVDVVRSPRQPGSSFKPFVYAAAFLNGASPATVLYDVPTRIGEDMPENFDEQFWGPLTVRRALGASRNIPASKAFFLAGGEETIIELASSMGIPTVRERREELSASRESRYEYGWPLALGAAEVPLYEMVQGYMTFARGGKAIDLVPVLNIKDRLGNILYEASAGPAEREALDPRAAFMITSILSDESVRPAGSWREQLSVPGYPTAAKTGTSNKCLKKDEKANVCLESKPDNTWTIGYTPLLVAGAWAGNASGGVLSARATGLTTDTPIWRQFMMAAHRKLSAPAPPDGRPDRPAGAFPVPAGLVSAQISELSGKLASPCTPVDKRRAEIFFEGEAPKEFDDACVEIEVDKLTGLLASDECPPEARVRGSFFRPGGSPPGSRPSPSGLRLASRPLFEEAVEEWARQVSAGTGSLFWKVVGTGEGEGEGWGEEGRKVFRGTGAFLPLPLPLAPTEKCRLDLTPGRLVKPTVRITSPAHGGTATAPSFTPRIEYTVGHAVREIRFELDGRIVAVVSSGSDLTSALQRTEGSAAGPTVRLPRRFDASGTHALKVTLVDSYFNEASDTVRFGFEEDREAPQISIVVPSAGATIPIGSALKVRAEARGRSEAIDRVQFFLGDQLITTRREEPYEIEFTIEGVPGPIQLKVVAWDAAKNRGEDSIEIELIVR